MSTRQLTHGREAGGPTATDTLYRWARVWVWLLPVWGLLLAVSTVTHQPDYKTDFEGYADYVTTTPFLVSHLVASIGGAALGVIGAVALAVALAGTPTARTALRGMSAFVAGQVLMTVGFGVAAVFQPAIGRAFQDGNDAVARAVNEDVYGPEVFGTIGVGLLLFVVGAALLGTAAARSGVGPVWAGRVLAIAAPVFAVAGFTLEILQPVAGLAIAVSAAALARAVSSD